MRTALRLLHQLKTAVMSIPSTPASALYLPTSNPEVRSSSLSTAASLLAESSLVAFPTETVYGLGASALSPEAVANIYKAKGRPSDNPLITHISSREMLLDLLPGRDSSVPAIYEPLMKRFWPGALTLIFPLEGDQPARRPVAPAVTAGHPSLAIRMPSHPLALDLIRRSDLPLAAPSANLSSRPSPTTAEHVRHDLGEGRGVAAILDGGSCEVGLESTVVDFAKPKKGGEDGELRVLRAGGVSAEDLEDCLREAGFGAASTDGEGSRRIKVYQRDFESDTLAAKPTTPGMKYKHYSPSNARVVLVRPTVSLSTTPTTEEEGITPTLQDLIAFSTFASTSDPPFRVGLMLTSSTLTSLSPLSSSTISPSCNLITLPPTSTAPEDVPFPAPDTPTLLYSFELGDPDRPAEAAQRLFAGLRYLDELPKDEGEEGTGVDLILVECVEEVGVGLAVMERARKAAGGAGEMSFRL